MRRSASHRLLDQPGPRHEVDHYDQSAEPAVLGRGDRVFIRCVGGPSTSRVEAFPPRLEIEEGRGTYTLVDVGCRQDWYYLFVPNQP